MKKLMMLMLALLLCLPAMAEEYPAIPVEIVNPVQGQMTQAEAMIKAQAEIPALPEQYQTRAEVVRMSDDTYRWVVTVFDLVTLADGWCVEVDASTGEVLRTEVSDEGYFAKIYLEWTEQKALHALWSLEDKTLYDSLYSMMPAYGMPKEGDLPAEVALQKALAALGLDSTGGYSVGYGYLMGGEGYNGVWEIFLVIDGEVDCQVNLDAVNGEVYYVESNQVGADEANG